MALRRAGLPDPTPPAHPRGAQLVRLLIALVDIHLANPAAFISLCAWDEIVTTGRAPDDLKGKPGIAQFESAVLREMALAEGRLSAAERWMPNADPRTLRMFQLPLPESMAKLFGDWDKQGEFQRGDADLSEQEARVMHLMLEVAEERLDDGTTLIRPLQSWEIATRMTPQRRRFGRAKGLPVETVDRYMRSARAKLRRMVNAPSLTEEALNPHNVNGQSVSVGLETS